MNPLPNNPPPIEFRQHEGRPPELIIHLPEIQGIGIRIIENFGKEFEGAAGQPLSGGDPKNISPVEGKPDKSVANPGDPTAEKGKTLERLAKQLIPERLLNLILPKFIFQRPGAGASNQQVDKSHAEVKQEKNQTSKSESAAKGESKFTDTTTGIPEEVDPLAQIPQDLFEKAAKEIPEKSNLLGKDDFLQKSAKNLATKEIHSLKGEQLDQPLGKHTPNQITQFMRNNISGQEISSQIAGEKQYSLEAMTVTQITLPQPNTGRDRNDPNEKNNAEKIEETTAAGKKNNETVRPKGNEGASVEIDKERHKPAEARKDVNFNVDRNESKTPEPVAKHNERVEYRFPFLPEMRNSDDNISGGSKGGKGSKLPQSVD